MAVLVNGSEITLSGVVGGDWFFDDGFTSSEVIRALAVVGDATDVTIRLNSGGGVVDEGSAIHAIISRHKAKKTIVVEGVAASAASLIAMAGDEIVMSLGAIMMVHNPRMDTWGGDIKDHQASARQLETYGKAMAGIYAAKTGRSEAECAADMEAETWMTPEEAVAKGYATSVGAAPEGANDPESQAVAAFDYRVYAHAPKRLTALAQKNGWRMDARRPAASAAPTRQKETPMADKNAGATTPEQHAEALEAAKAAAAAEATAKATAHAVEISTICAEAGVPAMASTLIKEGVTAEQARTRATSAKDIRAAVLAAQKSYPQITASADEFIAQGKSLEHVRAALFEKITAAQSPEINSFHQPAGNTASITAKASMERELKRAGLTKGA